MLCATPSSTGSSHSLSVSGTQILCDGTPVILRGISVGDPFLAREGRPLSDYETIAIDWHANTVRIDLHPTVWKHLPHSKVIQRLKENLDGARKAGLFVILTWHSIGFPDGYYQKSDYVDDPKDLYDSNFNLARSFWDEVATEFKDRQDVIFELWCEPVYSKNDFDPGNGLKWAQLKPKFEQLISAIRRQGSQIVLATGACWAYKLNGIREHPVEGQNIAYSWHIYAGTDENNETDWEKALDHLYTIAPVIVTEWGFQRHTKEHFKGTPETFGNKFVRDFLDGKNLHSTAWCWHPEWGPVMLKKDWKTPTEMGLFVKKYLTRHSSTTPEKK